VINTDVAHGGAACPALAETRDTCPDLIACPVNCVMSDWPEEFGACSATCGEGTKSKSREVLTPAANNGQECGNADQTIACSDALCPVDCVMADWSASGTCSAICGGGVQKYKRHVATQTVADGAACPADLEKEENCNEHACPWGPVGESGAQAMAMNVERSEHAVTLNAEFKTTPVVMVGPVPTKGGSAMAASSVSAVCRGTGCGASSLIKKAFDVTKKSTKSKDVAFVQKAAKAQVSCYLTYCNAYPDLQNAFCNRMTCVDGDIQECKTHWEDHGKKEGRSPSPDAPYLNYCNAYRDLKDAFCGGGACTTESHLAECKKHWNDHGKGEGRTPNPEMCTTTTTEATEVSYAPEPAPATPYPTAPPTPLPTPASSMDTPSPTPMMPEEPAVPLSGTFEELDPSATPTGKLPGCKCTGGPSNAIQFGDGNTQYPTEYGKFCSAWVPRDASAAEAQAAGQPELVYLGDLWGYNTVTKMRVYLGGQVNAASQTIGENVVLPAGVEIPDFEGEDGVVWPTSDEAWCYVASGCNGAMSDGWATWQSCGGWLCEESGNCAWDDHPAVAFPDDPEACPIGAYGGPKVQLTKLTRKQNSAANDICIGAEGFNDCNDESGAAGGVVIGVVSNVMLTSNMVLLRRAYSETSTDTCVFPDGQEATYCKGTSYGDATDLGWIFKGTNVLGSEELLGAWNTEYSTSCAMVKDVGDQNCWGEQIEALPSLGNILSIGSESAWAACGKGTAETQQQWEFTMAVDIEGSYTASDTEKIPWMVFQEGVYATADESMMQAGIAKVLAGNVTEVLTVPFHQAFSGTPIVIAQVTGSTGVVVRQRDPSADELYLLITGAEELDPGEPISINWMAFSATETGYFGSVPFVAGEMDGSDSAGDVHTWPDGAFSQIPIVFASPATDRTPGAVHVRTTAASPDGVTFVQEGTTTLEKVSYFAYNGKGANGATMNAVMDLEMIYSMVYTTWTTCSKEGVTTREATCKGTNGNVYPSIYCGRYVDTRTSASCQPPPRHPCDFNGAWQEGSVLVKLTMDAEDACTGSANDGAWTFTVTNSGSTLTISDGTVGTVSGAEPNARTISWGNGRTYTEQLPAACDFNGDWDSSGSTVKLTMDAEGACTGNANDGAWTFTVTNEGSTLTISDGTVGTVTGEEPNPRSIKWTNGGTYVEQLPA
jgi:hypothetical protein